mmetsp:Transcript_18921/g.26632  ORF Transcript_18921/g.26632 Transcript_18921/m.26632 type:complete len:445 (-) Transcript_18921:449-1783(-)
MTQFLSNVKLQSKKFMLYSMIVTTSFLNKILLIMDSGIHPYKILKNFNLITKILIKLVGKFSISLPGWTKSKNTILKIISEFIGELINTRIKNLFAILCVDSYLYIYDYKRKNANLNLINIEGQIGTLIDESRLLSGILIKYSFGNYNIPKCIFKPKVAIFNHPLLFFPKKSKYNTSINEINGLQYKYYNEVKEIDYFLKKLNLFGVNLILTQWGIDNFTNTFLSNNFILSVSWLKTEELELISLISKARILPRIQEINYNKLGSLSRIREIQTGFGYSILAFESFKNFNCISILITSPTSDLFAAIKKSLQNALRLTDLLFKNRYLTIGGGGFEIIALFFLLNMNTSFFKACNIFLLIFCSALDEIVQKTVNSVKSHPKFNLLNKIFRSTNNHLSIYTTFLNNIKSGNKWLSLLDPSIIVKSLYYVAISTINSIITVQDVYYG